MVVDSVSEPGAAKSIRREQRRVLMLLDEAVRRDIYFIAQHPSTLFQCLWNSCWWYDCPQAARHFKTSEGPWSRPGPKLHELLEAWRAVREENCPGFYWARSLRSPSIHLGTAQRAVLRRHEDSVWSVAISGDGRRIVSGSSDNTVRVWDAASGEELRCLRGHEDCVESVAISSDGRRIVSGSGDNTVRVWDGESGEELRCLRGHESRVYGVAISRDGRRIVSGSEDKTVRVWDAESGEELRCLRGHKLGVSSVAISTEGRRIASGSWDKTVRVWDAERGQELCCLRGHEDGVYSVAISNDARRIVSGSWDQTVRVWDAESGECLEVIEGLGDVDSIAAGAVAFPFRAIARSAETVIEDTAGRLMASFPERLDYLRTDLSGTLWAGASGKHVYFIALEGEPDQSLGCAVKAVV